MTRCCTHACTQGRDCPRRMWSQSTPARRSYDDQSDRLSWWALIGFSLCGLLINFGIAAFLIGGV